MEFIVRNGSFVLINKSGYKPLVRRKLVFIPSWIRPISDSVGERTNSGYGVVNERIHFFSDYVGIRSNRAREELSGFENRWSEFAKPEGGEDGVRGLFDVIP